MQAGEDTLLADENTHKATGLEGKVEGTCYSLLAVAMSRLLLEACNAHSWAPCLQVTVHFHSAPRGSAAISCPHLSWPSGCGYHSELQHLGSDPPLV